MLVKEVANIDDGQHGVHVAKVGVDEFLAYGRMYHGETILGFSILHACFVHVGSGGSRDEVMLCAWYTAVVADVQNITITMRITLFKESSALG